MTGPAEHRELDALAHPPVWADHAPRSNRAVLAGWAALLLFIPLMVLGLSRIVAGILGRPPMAATKLFTALAGSLPLLVGLILIGALMTFLHEVGHAIGGLIGGWQFHTIFLGPLRLTSVDGRLRLYWHRMYLFYGGAAVVVPARGQSPADERRARILYIVGGPVMSLLLGIGLPLLVRAAGFPLREAFAGKGIPYFALIAGVISFGLGVGTLIPQPMGGALRSDGLQLLTVLRSPKEDGVDPATRLALTYFQLFGARPREWDAALVDLLGILPESERLRFAYHRELDRGNIAGARELLQRALDVAAAAPGSDAGDRRMALALDAATFEAAWRGDAAAARAWRDRARAASGFHGHGANIADAALAHAEGDAARAAAALLAAERDLHQRTFVREDLLRAATLERIAMAG